MNVATIEVPKAEAEAKLKEYRRRVHANADTEYSRVLRAYEEAALGKPLLVLSQVMEQAPRDEKGRPMLAIARADRRQARVRVNENRDEFEVIDGQRSRNIRDRTVTIRRAGIPKKLAAHRAACRSHYVAQYGEENARKHPWHWQINPEGYALIPLVPPDVARGHVLSDRFTLWEVEKWADEPIAAVPDRDPYLLQRIADDLYAVVGEWDLTPLEQAIMRDRART